MSLSKTSQWVEEAKIILENAQKLASQANQCITTTNTIASKLENKVNYNTILLNNSKQAHINCQLVVQSAHALKNSSITSKIYETSPSLEKFHNILAQLRATNVPSFVSSQGSNLADFIAMDSIDQLYTNIEKYDANIAKITNLIDDQFTTLIENPFNNLCKNHKLLLQAFHDSYHSFQSSELSKFMQEISELEQHLAQLLSMITKHYDQCVDAFNIVKSGQEIADLSILEKDTQELIYIQRELHQVTTVLLSNDAKSREIASNLLDKFANLELSLEKHLQNYKKFKHFELSKYCTLVVTLESFIISETANIQIECNELDKLIDHYKNFLKVYKKNYFKELHYEKYVYPRAFLAKLNDFINKELGDLHVQEQERRKNWLEKYGNYIPSEFSLPGEGQYPNIVQIMTEGLESTEESPEIERKILDLIAS